SHFLVGASNVTYTATDVAGNSTAVNFTVTVTPAGFVGNILYVVGTSADEAFVVNATNPAAVTVTINGTSVAGSPFNATGKTIAVYGNAGKDSFSVSGSVATTVDGGTGSNTLLGGAAATTFTINGADAGTSGSITFTNVGNLTGGASSDTFAFSGN